MFILLHVNGVLLYIITYIIELIKIALTIKTMHPSPHPPNPTQELTVDSMMRFNRRVLLFQETTNLF